MSEAGPKPQNTPELSVSELAGAIRRTLEGAFERVRVKGELGRVTFHANGHVYLDLKDDKASINAVIWRPQAARLKLRPEEGLEVIALGRLTTYAPRSVYQLVIEDLVPSGVGALMALLERRRQALAAEGLFEPTRKKKLPFLPELIGVITSPTGAVIRDILHRLADRFPRHVLLWPVVVQGERAAGEVAAAIEGFNRLPKDGPVKRPDLLIVARGGGSIEDLWPFNEEIVVRAAAASAIPLISAVGHETDTTLIDFAADLRAPTPTAAAELAVPVRAELVAQVVDFARRQTQAMRRLLNEHRRHLDALTRALPRAQGLVGEARQSLDRLAARLPRALAAQAARAHSRLASIGGRLRPSLVLFVARTNRQKLDDLVRRARGATLRLLPVLARRLAQAGRMLETLSFERTLERGFSLVTDSAGRVVRSGGEARVAKSVRLRFKGADEVAARIVPAEEPARSSPAAPRQRRLL
jgi:exodeoxyribonuclease VII large subunit